MSTLNNLAALTQFGEDPRRIAFVKELTEKTRQGKVPWATRLNGITATLPGGLEVNFVISQSLGGGVYWKLFTLRDSRGNELIKTSLGPLVLYANPVPVPGATTLSLEDAISELFAVVNKSASDELDRAISTVKNL